MVDYYALGIEPRDDLEGWSVHAGAEGDDPRFVAFFLRKDLADWYAGELRKDDNTGIDVSPAIVTKDLGIVTANDFELKTHGDLRDRIRTALRKLSREETDPR